MLIHLYIVIIVLKFHYSIGISYIVQRINTIHVNYWLCGLMINCKITHKL